MSKEFWKVTMVHRDANNAESPRSIAPYMEQPMIFECERHEAEAEFRKKHGIISTVHSFTVEKATADNMDEQKAAYARWPEKSLNVAIKEWQLFKAAKPDEAAEWLEEFRTRPQAA